MNGRIAWAFGILGFAALLFGLVIVVSSRDCEELGCLAIPLGLALSNLGLLVSGVSLAGTIGAVSLAVGLFTIALWVVLYLNSGAYPQALVFLCAGGVAYGARRARLKVGAKA